VNGMFWDQVICDTKLEEITEKGNKTFTRCEGVMLPITHLTPHPERLSINIWKCHKCGREVYAILRKYRLDTSKLRTMTNMRQNHFTSLYTNVENAEKSHHDLLKLKKGGIKEKK
jgi:ribosomal protein L37AE/L43A